MPCLTSSQPPFYPSTATTVFSEQILTRFALTVLYLEMRCAVASRFLPQVFLMLPPEVPVEPAGHTCMGNHVMHGEHLHLVGSGASGHRPLPSPPTPFVDCSETHGLFLRRFQWAGAPNVMTFRLDFFSQLLSPAPWNHLLNILPAHKPLLRL